MIKRVVIALISIVTLSLNSCKNLEDKFTVQYANGNVHYQASSFGLQLFIPVALISDQANIQTVYFKSRKTTDVTQTEDYFIVNFKNSRVRVMHSDPTKEIGNSVPTITKPPCKLDKDEALVAYIVAEDKVALRIKDIQQQSVATPQ